MTMTAEHREALLVEIFSEYLLGTYTQGQLLQYLRKQVLGVNQTQFAELVGISRRTLSDIELDKGSPAQSVLDKLFKPFGLKAGVVPIHLQVVHKLMKSGNAAPPETDG